jgi:hypothetical protein
MAKFVLAGVTAPEKVVALHLEEKQVAPGQNQFNIIVTLPSGKEVELAGVETRDGKLTIYRWGGLHLNHELTEYVHFNADSGRIVDQHPDE